MISEIANKIGLNLCWHDWETALCWKIDADGMPLKDQNLLKVRICKKCRKYEIIGEIIK